MNNAEVLLDQVEIVLTNENGCENNPHEKMDESCKFFLRISTNPKHRKIPPIKNVSAYNHHKKYFSPYFSDQLTVGRKRNGPKAYINATSSWGALRGLESFTQLIYSTKESGFKVTN